MREVAKSMLGLSWAVSLFGLQQFSKVMTPASGDADGATASEVDEVSRAVQSRLSGAAAEQFRAGDEWQRRMVDAMFDAATLRSVDPRRIADALDPRAMVETGVSVVQKGLDSAVDTMRQTADTAVDAARRMVGSVRPSA